MKFSHSLQFNAVPEWSSKYIAYSTLKKLIYSLQRESLKSSSPTLNSESDHLIANDHSLNSTSVDPVRTFTSALNAELEKIDEFYKIKESLIYDDIEVLYSDFQNFEIDLSLQEQASSNLNLNGSKNDNSPPNIASSNSSVKSFFPDNHESNTNLIDTHLLTKVNLKPNTEENRGRTRSLDKSTDNLIPTLSNRERRERELLKTPELWAELDENDPFSILLENRIVLKKRIISAFTVLSELKSYIELNNTGFKKALKKFDKSLNTNSKDDYLSDLPNISYVFKSQVMDKLNQQMDLVINLYSSICANGNFNQAKNELSLHLRDHVVWERNTVWRDMIGIERKTYGAAVNKHKSLTDETSNQGTDDKNVFTKPSMILVNTSFLKLLIISIITLILLKVSPFEIKTEKNCFALLVCASLLWATEAVPLFVTSLLVPLLIVTFKVLRNDDGSIMEAPIASKYILSTMWSSVILLLLGGFTLAAALTKYHIAKLISTWLLSKAGTDPKIILITIMSVALFASMWVSNVAAPVLCFSIIQPLLRTLPKDSKFAKSLILGIAFASNIGGMASPIASPQNMIAIASMEPQPSWGQWFVIALPVCFLSLIVVWLVLMFSFRSNSRTHIAPIRTIDDKFTNVQWYIIAVSAGTIILWCLASKLESVFGEMGIIALLPMLLFFGPGLLTTEDFNNYPWNIVVLAMGGIALGKAVSSSGLLNTIASGIQYEVKDFSLFGVLLTFGLLILTVATFVSHTVAALIIIPLVSEIGNAMPDPHSRLLVMASALLCSAAMGLPTSGFPNVTAICMTDEVGKPYLSVNTFITRGVPCSVFVYSIIVTVGYVIMRTINF